MTVSNDIRNSTTLSRVPPAETGAPHPLVTAPRALKAARALKHVAADLGVTSSDDLLAMVLALALAFAREIDLDLADFCRSLCPAMLDALEFCGAPKSPPGPWDPFAFNGHVPAEELSRKATLIHAIFCVEAVSMGFGEELWGLVAIWVLVALLVNSLGIERARLKLDIVLGL